MKITLDIGSVLEDIYADSALGAVMGLRDAALPVPLLTRDHRHALSRMAVHAAAHVCSMSGLSHHILSVNLPTGDAEKPMLSLDLNCENDRIPAEEAMLFHLRAAVSASTLHFVALAGNDKERADRFDALARYEASTLDSLLSPAHTFTLRMRNG